YLLSLSLERSRRDCRRYPRVWVQRDPLRQSGGLQWAPRDHSFWQHGFDPHDRTCDLGQRAGHDHKFEWDRRQLAILHGAGTLFSLEPSYYAGPLAWPPGGAWCSAVPWIFFLSG